MDLVNQVLAGRYRILRRLGSGGMGTVYLAEHVHLGRPTAVKVLRPELGTDVRAEARFRREAMLAARINHPSVAQIHDFDRGPHGEFLLAMEYVEGETVAQRLERTGPLPIGEAVEVLVKVAGGLDRAHHLGILHRDLKPENIMLGRGGVVKLLDFGVAQAVDTSSEITSGGIVVGTPSYMSPEQLVGDALTAASDIYSLGAVFYEMLTNQGPHSGVSFVEIRAQRFQRPPPRLDLLRPECPAELAAVVARALDLQPEARWPTAVAFATAAAQVVSAPVTASLPVSGQGAVPVERWEAHYDALRFAGRDREIRQVRDAWAAARGGRAITLWVEGDEGTGKSAFFDLVRREAGADGAVELTGRGYEVDVARPYGPWIGMLRSALDLHGAGDRSWPAIQALTDAFQATPVPERAVLYDEVSALLHAVASRGPVFVGLEDLDCCDPASTALFELVASDVTGASLLLAATVDPGQPHAASRAREIRERLGRLSHVLRIRLKPLGYEAAAGWLANALGEEPPEALLRFVYGHTEGNAFFIEQVVRSLVERGELDQLSEERVRVALANAPPPEAVADVLRRRLNGMSEAAREVLQIAAVVGREFDTELVITLARRGEEAVLDAVDEAVAAGILLPVAEAPGDVYRFTHGKIADVHAQAMNQRRRRRLHGQIAEVLAARAGTPPGSIAWHWYHARERGRASGAARAAARQAIAVHDYDDALTFAMMAVEVAETDDERREAHELRGDALRRLDRHEDAAAAYAHARVFAGAEDVLRRLRCKELRSALVAEAISGEAALLEARNLAAAAGEAPADQRAAVELVLAEASLAAGDVDAAAAAAGPARDRALEADLRDKAGDALIVLGRARLRQGDLTGARAAADEAGALFAELHDGYGGARARMLQGAVAQAMGEGTVAAAAYDRALEEARRARVTRLVRLIAEEREAVVGGGSA